MLQIVLVRKLNDQGKLGSARTQRRRCRIAAGDDPEQFCRKWQAGGDTGYASDHLIHRGDVRTYSCSK